MNIIIADDSLLMRKNLKTILQEAGFRVVAEASNGKEAVQLYRDFKPDIMTMDITMPVMSGIDAVKQIVSEFPDAKIIMISALDQKRMVFKAIENGAKQYIVKPFKVSKVLESVYKVMEDVKRTDSSEEPVKNKDPEKDPVKSSYTISNQEGVFVIKIAGCLDSKNFIQLEGTVEGLIFIPNLQVELNLKECLNPDEVTFILKPLEKKLKQAGAQVEIIS